MKEIKIDIPEGYEIDKENSTFECIKFKKKVNGINTWKDIEYLSGIGYVSENGIQPILDCGTNEFI